MSRTALAFMSYVNEDDRHDNGWMTQFRERLSGEVRMHTGEPFDIFQDRKDIAWGQQWQERINQSLDAVTFLIPILTPAFFKSTACRDELERFLKREETLGRSDLILPVYYVNCPVLSDKAKREHDTLAQIIAARQYADWRELRFEEFTSPQLRKALAKMAQQIMAALERSQAEASRQQPEKESKKPSSTANTFQSSGGPQNIAQGSNPIGTQINYYGPQVPIELVRQRLEKNKPQPAPAAKTERPIVVVSAEGKYASISDAFNAVLQRKENKKQSEPAAKADPPTVVVDQKGHGNYETISDALWEVKPGTRILVRPGLYKESIEIDKPVKIEGDGKRKEIVIEADGTSAIVFNSDNGRVANLTLTQPNDSTWPCVEIVHGILELEGCDISSQGACVVIHDSATALLRANYIHDGKGTGIVFHGNNQVTMENNKIVANVGHGVLIGGGSKPILRCNRILKNSGVGIWVYEGGGGIFEDNDLRDNTEGAWYIAPDCEANVQRRGNKE